MELWKYKKYMINYRFVYWLKLNFALVIILTIKHFVRIEVLVVFHKLLKVTKDDCLIMIVPNDLKRPFKSEHIFKDNTIQQAFKFAYEMSYGSGFHRDSRSGGILHRKSSEVFANTFQGKLAECAVYNLFYRFKNKTEVDFDIYGKGVWDDVDLIINGKAVSIKSSKFFSQLFLLETSDWDEQGRYLPNIDLGRILYDYFIFVRIKPSIVDLLKRNRLLYSNFVAKNDLDKLIFSEDWSYEVSGYLTKDDLVEVIHNNHIIHQGEFLNKIDTKMDADNYYVLLYDLRDISDLLEELWQYE